MKRNTIIKTLACALVGLSACALTACKPSEENKGNTNAPVAQTPSLKTSYITESNISLSSGEQYTLGLVNTTAKEWTTSNASVATVAGGVVTGVGAGVAFINATAEDGQSFVCMVNVSATDANPTIVLSANKRVVGVGDVFSVSATPYVEGVVLSDAVTWSNSAEDVVRITPNGNTVTIEALKAGTAQIGASKDGATTVLSLTVREQFGTLATYESPEGMTGAPATEMLYTDGAAIEMFEEGDSSALYPEIYYGTYEGTSSLAMFATLSDTRRDFEWKQAGHYAYGFIVEAIQIYDDLSKTKEGEKTVYYAVEGANQAGNYGLVIKNVPEGYYEIRSFVEYEQRGSIIKEISVERAVAGNYAPEFASSAEQFVAVTSFTNGLDGANVGFFEDVKTYEGEPFTDSNGVTKSAQYSVTETAYTTKSGKTVLPSINFKVRTPMTKRMLEELTIGQISTVSFDVCYKTEKNCKGKLNTLNLNALTEKNKANTAHFDSTVIDYSFAYSNQNLGAWRKELGKVYLAESCMSNTWYTITMPVKKMVEYYDVLFDPHSGYSLMGFSMSGNAVEEGESGIGELLISDFTFQTYKVDNLAPTASSLNVNRTQNGTTGPWGIGERGSEKVEAIPNDGAEKLTWTDDKGVTKDIAYSFEIPVREKQDSSYGHYMLVVADLSYLSKEILIDLQEQGYTKLEFSFVYHNACQFGIKLATINFDWLRAEPTGEEGDTAEHKVSGWRPPEASLPLVNKNAYTISSPSGVQTDDWVHIEYQLSDLIDCYEKLFIGKYMVLGGATSNYVNLEPAQFYLSNIALTK